VPDITLDAFTASVRVRRQIDPDTNYAIEVLDDYVKLVVDGAEIGVNMAQSQIVPIAEDSIVYEWDLLALGVTVDDVNDGLIQGVRLGWDTNPEDASAYDSENWEIEYEYSGVTGGAVVPGTTSGTTGKSGSHRCNGSPAATWVATHTMTFTWVGEDDPPDYVIASVVSQFGLQYTPGAVPVAFIYNNGQGESGSVSLGVPGAYTYGSSLKHKLTVSAGVAVLEIPVSCSGENGCLFYSEVIAGIVPPDPATLLVDSIDLQVCYTAESGSTVNLVGAQGLGYGDFDGDEFAVIWGEGAFSVDADVVSSAMDYDWSDELSDKRLGTGKFVLWQYGDRIYATNPDAGTYYRTIGDDDWTTLFEDTQSPGSTGDASIALNMPPYADNGYFDSSASVDTIAMISSSGRATGATAAFSPLGVDAKPKIVTPDSGGGYGSGVIEYEITLATARDWSEGNVLTYRLAAVNLDGTEPSNDGFWNGDPSLFTLTLTDGGGSSDTFTAKVDGVMNTQQGYCYAFVDLTGASIDLSDVKKIKFKLNSWMTGIGVYSLGALNVGGVIYHDIAGNLGAKSDLTEDPLEYAYWFTEGGDVSQAKKVVASAKDHLGRTRSFASFVNGGLSSYGGSQVTVTIPKADSPFTSAATIHLARWVDGQWQEIETGPNTAELVYRDVIPDSLIAADEVTYPVVIPDFDNSTPLEGGAVSGVVCGCSWKGSNVYAGKDGKIYFSRQNAPNEVLWDNVTLTNEIGSADLGPARTAVLADNTSDYALAMVPAGNLYCFTKRDAWVFVEGDTAATASFPRRIDGVRGVVGIRAACAYGDRALVGCQDGLWLVKKSSDLGEQPDLLTEVTSDDRGAWAWLLGDSPSTLVVRTLLGEVYCFNQNRFLIFSREQHCIPGAWADGRMVEDAYADPLRGIVMQMSDGHLCVIGDFVTDGATNVQGDNGTSFRWLYRSGRVNEAIDVRRAIVRCLSSHANGSSIEVVASGNEDDVRATVDGEFECVRNLSLVRGTNARLRSWFNVEMTGGALDTVFGLSLEADIRDEVRR
jgi:hypothetical protein